MVIRKVLLACAFVFLASWAQNGFIAVDQFGYRPEAQKTAVISYEPGAALQVINQATGESVFSGAPTSFQGGAIDAASGDKIWWFDFSSVEEPGTYYIKDASNSKESYSFRIASDIYNNVLQAAIKVFYYQRAGTDKPSQYAGQSWADGLNFQQDKQTRYFFAKGDASTARDLSGGWFDAGDYNKYTAWTANYVESMLLAYEENPDAFTDDYGIPESGNGVPDILDETKWGIEWLLKMQNPDGSVLSVQGLADGTPPSSVTGASYYGPANSTASFGTAKALAIASRFFGARGENEYAENLKTAAIKAWDWAVANPDSIFHNNCGDTWNKENCPNYDSRGLAAGDQELTDPWDRVESYISAAYYLYELTGTDSFLTIFEDNLNKLPLYDWNNFMDQYRHSMHLLYMRYLSNPNGNSTVKSVLRNKLITAFAKSADFLGAYQSDGYRSFIKDYPWGSNKSKTDYGLTFYKWDIVNSSANYKNIAEDYIHYIHGVNPFNMVYLTNMNNYGTSKSLTTIYHTWFSENSDKWGITTSVNPGPAPGYMPGGPNSEFGLDGCCPSSCGSAGNNARCSLIEVPINQPPAKMYKEMNHSWPLNSWQITEPSNGYQLSYIRLLSKFVKKGGYTPAIKQAPKANPAIATAHWSGNNLVIQSARAIDYVALFDLKNRIVAAHSGGSSEIRLNADIPAGVYYLKIKSGSAVMVRAMIRK